MPIAFGDRTHPVWDALRVQTLQGLPTSDQLSGVSSISGLGNSIIVFHSNGADLELFDPIEAGLIAALAAAATGDTVWLPSIKITVTAAVALVVGVLLRGIDTSAEISRTANSATDLVTLQAPASGAAYLSHVKITCTQSGAGDAIALNGGAGQVFARDSELNGQSTGGAGYGVRGSTGTITLDDCWIQGSTAPLDATTGAYSVGSQISTGTINGNDTAGAEISGLTIGNWYAVEATGGPFNLLGGATNWDSYRFYLNTSNTLIMDSSIAPGWAGSLVPISPATLLLNKPAWAAHAEAVDTRRARIYFKATTTSVWFWCADGPPSSQYGDNTGSLGWKLSSATDPSSNVLTHATRLDPVSGEPVQGDRGVWDALDYRDRHTNDINNSDGIHHTLAALDDRYRFLDWFVVTDYGAVGNGITDDTTAIQATINAAAAAGGGVVYFPRGVYIVGGALQDGARANAQLLLPSVDIATGDPLTIYLLGESPPAAVPTMYATGVNTDHGSIIKGTLNSGAGGALLGVEGPSGSIGDFSFINVAIENLTFRLPSNPVLSAVNLKYATKASLNYVNIDASEYVYINVAQPTTATSYGLYTPMTGNGGGAYVRNLIIIGFYNGISVGEHSNLDFVATSACVIGFEYQAANFGSIGQRIGATWCVTPMKIIGSHHIQIEQWSEEIYNPAWYGAKWFEPGTYDVEDASNYGIGYVIYYNQFSYAGGEETITVNGGANLRFVKLADVRLSATGTVTSIATGTGLTGGPITTTGTISDANTGVAAATYGDATHVPQIAVNAQGRITTASNVTITAGHTIQDEGTPLTNRANLNFVGTGVTATDDSGNNATVITIPGAFTPINVYNETQTADGINTTYYLTNLAAPGTIRVYIDGIRQPASDDTDPTDVVTFSSLPVLGALLMFDYEMDQT